MSSISPVIVLGSYYNALSIIQIFGTQQIPCYVLSSKKSVAGRSRYAKFVKCPCPIKSETEFIHFLKTFLKSLQVKPVIIPTMDQWALALSKLKRTEEHLAKWVVDDYETISLLLNKEAFYAMASSKNWSVPRSYAFEDAKVIPSSAFPLVAKPNYRMQSDDETTEIEGIAAKLQSYRLITLNNQDELNQFIEQPKNQAILPFLILQEYIQGDSNTMYTYGVYAENGDVLGDFQGRKVRGYPAEYGDCVVGQLESIPDSVINEAKAILNSLNYSGIAEVEYKRDAHSQAFRLIEINPRSWSWIGITQFTAHNLPMVAYLSKTNQAVPENNPNRKKGHIIFKKSISDRFNALYRYPKTFPKWQQNRKSLKAEFQNDFVMRAEFMHKDYWQWIYSWCFENAVLYINWFIRKK
ncbi:MAG: hypothetical protein JJT77_08770 [Crocinitomicaceae bacterium]|nr:hypothetical protein [Crocinitomicaceae bacterium]